jgi:hypothetical protein
MSRQRSHPPSGPACPGVVTVVGSMTVPDRPGYKSDEYPIGLHSITVILRFAH